MQKDERKMYKPSLLARIKAILPNWIVRIEFCQRCGITQPLCWTCDDDLLWKEINGSMNGVLCPKCFYDLARQKNFFVIFHARADYVRDKVGEEWQPTKPPVLGL